MSVQQLDSFAPPTDAVLDAAKAAGVEVWPGYLGGPECAAPTNDPTGWGPQAFARVRAKGLRCPGIYVGLGTGAEAVALAQARGIPAGEVIWHDIETAYSEANDPLPTDDAWVGGVKSGGYVPGLYSTASFAGAHASRYPMQWIAGGDFYRNGPGSMPWPDVMTVPHCAPSRRPAGVQWWATHDEFGWSVDRSVMDDVFGGHAMDPAKEASLDQFDAWIAFVLVMGRQMDASTFNWEVTVTDKAPAQIIWDCLGSPEFTDPVNGGGLLGHIARHDAAIAHLTSQLSADEQQQLGQKQDAAVNQVLDLLRKMATDIQTAIAAPTASA